MLMQAGSWSTALPLRSRFESLRPIACTARMNWVRIAEENDGIRRASAVRLVHNVKRAERMG